ncbi:MAG: hypothetical protein ACXVZH_01430 [Terriglobales bacterium]
MKRRRWFFLIPIAIAAFIFIGGEVVMQLWNWLLPGLFGWRHITFWQGLGLLLLSRILFGGLGHGGPRGRRCHRDHLSPEERQKFRDILRTRWGGMEGETGGSKEHA